MNDLVYYFFNFLVKIIPGPVRRRILRVFYVYPDLAEREGYYIYPQVFGNPFPNPSEIDLTLLKAKRDLPAVDLNVAGALRLVTELSAFSGEVDKFLKKRKGDLRRWDDTFQPCDSASLYAMLRKLKPKRYIEVGCGFSSRSSVAALNRNQLDGYQCKSLFVEPSPPPYLTEIKLPGELLAKKVQEVSLERFKELEAGDVLFIDTSHVIKAQNDVEYELIHILPSLKPGVIVHIHDIFTPYDYPAEWLVGDGRNRGGNNEQYALECLLSGGKNWEVILPVYLLWLEHAEALGSLCYTEHRPAAFWMKKVA